MQTKKRPNILLITTDQQRADHLGVKGLRGIKTPNLDRLATEGVHFDRAYCPSPICTPTRVSLLTGMWPSRHGAYSIGVSIDDFPQFTLPAALKANGYSTSLIGKTHFVRRDEEASHFAGHEDPSPEFFREFHGPYLGFDTVYTCVGHTISCKPNMHYRVFLEDTAGDYKRWFPLLNDTKQKYVPGLWELPEELGNTSWVAQTTENWIKEQDPQQPWFCWASFEDPHPPYVCPEPWYSSVDTKQIQLFEGMREGEFNDKPPIYELTYRNDLKVYADGPGVPCATGRRHENEEEFKAMQATLGMIANIDAKLGRIMEVLESTRQLDNTVIIYTSDHGDMLGHHGLWGKGLPAYEDNQRVPLLMWGPSFFSKKGTTNAIANLVDVSRTIMSLAGAAAPIGVQGTDLTPVLTGEAESVQDSTVVECQATQKIYQQTLITARYKLVIYRDTDEGELYDLEQDPDQYVNLWNDPGTQELKTQLMHKFLAKQMQREGIRNPRLAFA